MSSDGGAVLLKACGKRLGLTEAIVGCLRDERSAEHVMHGIRELVEQRVCGMAVDARIITSTLMG